MPRYSDAVFLEGDYAHMAAQLKAGERSAPTPASPKTTKTKAARR